MWTVDRQRGSAKETIQPKPMPKEKMMSNLKQTRNTAVIVPALSIAAIVCALGATEHAFGQIPSWHSNFNHGTSAAQSWNSTPSTPTPSWHRNFNQGTSAARAWNPPAYQNSPAAGYTNRLSQGSSVWRQNQESIRQSMLMPRSGNYKTYAAPTPHHGTVVTRPSHSWTSSWGRSRRGLLGRRWRR